MGLYPVGKSVQGAVFIAPVTQAGSAGEGDPALGDSPGEPPGTAQLPPCRTLPDTHSGTCCREHLSLKCFPWNNPGTKARERLAK